MHIASKVMIVLVVVVAVVFPLMISFFFGGQISLYISPPYSFNDIPDLTGAKLFRYRNFQSKARLRLN